jgi:hypothetical protein
MKPKTKRDKAATKTNSKSAARRRKAPSNKKTTTAPRKSAKKPAKKPARKTTKAVARRRDDTRTPNAPCDGFANRELGIVAAMPPRPKMRAAGAPRAGSSDWRPAKSLVTLKEQVNAKAPRRSKSHDGMIGDARHRTRNSDHNPWVDEGVVTAYDITNDPENGCDVSRLAEAIRSAVDPRVKYLIWKRRICNYAPIGSAAAWEWRSYGGSNPHDKHLHISVKETKPHYDNTDPWPV